MKQLVLLDKVEVFTTHNCLMNSRAIGYINSGVGIAIDILLEDGQLFEWYYASHELQKLKKRGSE